jgi:hypothetical protein
MSQSHCGASIETTDPLGGLLRVAVRFDTALGGSCFRAVPRSKRAKRQKKSLCDCRAFFQRGLLS